MAGLQRGTGAWDGVPHPSTIQNVAWAKLTSKSSGCSLNVQSEDAMTCQLCMLVTA